MASSRDTEYWMEAWEEKARAVKGLSLQSRVILTIFTIFGWLSLIEIGIVILEIFSNFKQYII